MKSIGRFIDLNKWFHSQCDGDWEHAYGISISTLDNPGWIVKVDTARTALDGFVQPLIKQDRSDEDWVQYEFTEDGFVGCGGIDNLNEVIDFFLCTIDAQKKIGLS